MDTDALVEETRIFLSLADQTRIKPRFAMWVHAPDVDRWRLWMVSSSEIQDMRDFYRIASGIISNNRSSFNNIDVGDIEYMKENHPAISALSKMYGVHDNSMVTIKSSMLNGYFLPDGIILRSELNKR